MKFENNQEIRDFVIKNLKEKKATDIVIYSSDKYSRGIDFAILASGRSTKSVGAIAEHISKELKHNGISNYVEGLESCQWVFMDFNSINLHIFYPETRVYYNIEELYNLRFDNVEKIEDQDQIINFYSE